MGKLIYDISASLDGFSTATGVRPEEQLGDGGQQLHAWAMGEDPSGAELLDRSQGRSGATIAGRRTYDLAISSWGADGPGGAERTPTFIVSHDVPDDVPEGGVYTFVDSPATALRQARAAAGERDVDVFSSSIGNQLLQAGEVDEIHLHIAPVLFGAGTPLFEPLGAHVHLELFGIDRTSTAVHLRYRVLSRSDDE